MLEEHKKEKSAYMKKYYQEHKQELNASRKKYNQEHNTYKACKICKLEYPGKEMRGEICYLCSAENNT